MKNLIIAILFMSCIWNGSYAQTDQRTIKTKIADLLATMPTQNKDQLKAGMDEMTSFGNDGLVRLFTTLTPPGKGNNTALEYAAGSYSYYVLQQGKENERKTLVDAYCKTLSQLSDTENKRFIISQLLIAGNDQAVPALQGYLNNEKLRDITANALAQIGTPVARQALLSAARTLKGDALLPVINALGYCQAKEALLLFKNYAVSNDVKLKKAALYGLARTGDPSVSKIMYDAVEKAGYQYDQSDALDAYMVWGQNLIKNNQTMVALNAANNLQNKSKKDNQVAARCAGLELLVACKGDKAIAELVTAVKDSNPEYRAAAVRYALPYSNSNTLSYWTSALAQANAEAKPGIIRLIGESNDKKAVTYLLSSLQSNNKEVKKAAIAAIGKCGKDEAVPHLLSVMKKGDTEDIGNAKEALLQIDSKPVCEGIGQSLSQMPSTALAACLEILAARADHESAPLVMYQVNNSKDPVVHKAAVYALSSVVTTEEFDRLIPILLNSSTEDIPSIQKAIVASLKYKGRGNAELVTRQMQAAPADKQYLFLPVLSGMGGKDALNEIEKVFANGNAQTKQTAVNSLAEWKDEASIPALLRIARQYPNENYFNSALKGLVLITSKSNLPVDQKLLLFEEAMSLAKNKEQKQMIINLTDQLKTFPALVFTGKYLDDADVQQQAANTVMNITLSDKQFAGDITRKLLTKARTLLKGPDSEYQQKAIDKYLTEMPAETGFVAIFNEKDLTGWKGLVKNPLERAKMNVQTLATEQQKADKIMREGWYVKDGALYFSGKGDNLCTQKQYGSIELWVDWKIEKEGDAGIYLRGSPQVQIWDTARRDVGAQVGSGGLYNNKRYPSNPLLVADNPIGEWNTFHIIMKGDKVTVYLNGKLVTDNVTLENYWDRKQPIFPKGEIELQAHGTLVAYRNIYVKELPEFKPFELSDEEKKEGYTVLFDGTDLHNWTGDTSSYVVEDGLIAVKPKGNGHGNLYSKEEYSDFIVRFEFKLTPGANNGLGIRAPLEGDAAYVGYELQILDNDADIYKNLETYQYHGSLYGLAPAKRGYLKPLGEWNYEEVIVKGDKVKVILNNTVILDVDIKEATKNGTLDKQNHPGLKRTSGHIGFLGHGSEVWFKNIRIKKL